MAAAIAPDIRGAKGFTLAKKRPVKGVYMYRRVLVNGAIDTSNLVVNIDRSRQVCRAMPGRASPNGPKPTFGLTG